MSTSRAGEALRAAVLDAYEVGPADLPLLDALCQTADALEGIAASLSDKPSDLRLLRAHHAAALTFARLRASLGLHTGDEEDARGRPGVYAPGANK